MIANTQEEAPRNPAHEINKHCLNPHLQGSISKNTAIGLATNVKIATITSAVGMILGI